MNLRFSILDSRLRDFGRRVPEACPQSKIKNRKSKFSRPPGAAGFTLLEVLVALSIFALAAVVLGSAYLNVLNSYETLSRGLQVSEDFAYARQLVLREPDRLKLEEGG